jgi:hypothetical protein
MTTNKKVGHSTSSRIIVDNLSKRWCLRQELKKKGVKFAKSGEKGKGESLPFLRQALPSVTFFSYGDQ